jgi:hypothetical protein
VCVCVCECVCVRTRARACVRVRVALAVCVALCIGIYFLGFLSCCYEKQLVGDVSYYGPMWGH